MGLTTPEHQDGYIFSRRSFIVLKLQMTVLTISSCRETYVLGRFDRGDKDSSLSIVLYWEKSGPVDRTTRC